MAETGEESFSCVLEELFHQEELVAECNDECRTVGSNNSTGKNGTDKNGTGKNGTVKMAQKKGHR